MGGLDYMNGHKVFIKKDFEIVVTPKKVDGFYTWFYDIDEKSYAVKCDHLPRTEYGWKLSQVL